MKSKDQIAYDEYGCDFVDCTSGEKAHVSKIYKAQSTRTVAAPRGAYKCFVGRINVNGTKMCLVSKTKTVGELIEQAEYPFDPKKESITALSTGEVVDLDSTVENNETYMIVPEIKSA